MSAFREDPTKKWLRGLSEDHGDILSESIQPDGRTMVTFSDGYRTFYDSADYSDPNEATAQHSPEAYQQQAMDFIMSQQATQQAQPARMELNETSDPVVDEQYNRLLGLQLAISKYPDADINSLIDYARQITEWIVRGVVPPGTEQVGTLKDTGTIKGTGDPAPVAPEVTGKPWQAEDSPEGPPRVPPRGQAARRPQAAPEGRWAAGLDTAGHGGV